MGGIKITRRTLHRKLYVLRSSPNIVSFKTNPAQNMRHVEFVEHVRMRIDAVYSIVYITIYIGSSHPCDVIKLLNAAKRARARE